MAGIPEADAMAAKARGIGLAKHLGVKPGSDRFNAIEYGTARKAGWMPSREAKGGGASIKASRARLAKNSMRGGR
jgi:hypothetical protein